MFRRKIVHLDFYLNRCLWQFHARHPRRKCCGHDRPEIIFLPIVSEVFNCVDDVVWPEISAFDMCSSASVNWDGDRQ